MCEPMALRMTKGAEKILAAIAERNKTIAEQRKMVAYPKEPVVPVYVTAGEREPAYAGR